MSVITASQKLNALAPIVRLNSSSLYIFKLKNQAELDTFIQEQSALIDKKTMNEICRVAVNDQPYSFLFVKLRESDVFFFNEKIREGYSYQSIILSLNNIMD